MKLIYIYTFKVLALLLIMSSQISFRAYGQDEQIIIEEDEAVEEEFVEEEEIVLEEPAIIDTVRLLVNKKPFGIQIGVDLLKLASFAIDAETKYEGQVGISYKNFHLIAEAGFVNYAYAIAYKNSEDYEVEGEYYRFGIDYAFNLSLKNQLLLGIRYGMSTFGDKGSFEVSSELWDNYSFALDEQARADATATWGEVIVGTQSLIAKNLHFGWYFRLRKLIDRTSYDPVDIYYVPGYGKSNSQTVPALNLFLKYKLSF